MAALIQSPADPSHPEPPDRHDSGVRGTARHGIVNLFGVVAAALAAFAVNIVVTRGWSMADAGLFFTATSAFSIAYGLTRMGVGTGAVYFVSRYRALGQPDQLRAVLLVGLIPVAVTGVAMAALGWAGAPWLVELMYTEPDPRAETTLRLLSLFVPVAALADVALAACRGFGRMRPLLLVERVGRNGLQLAAVALAATVGASVFTGLPLAWVAPYAPAAAVALVWLALLVRRAQRAAAAPVARDGAGSPVPEKVAGDPRAATMRAQAWPFWRFAGPRGLTGLAQIVVQRLDIVLLGALRGLAEAAIYTAATRFLILGKLAGQALSAAVQHRIAAYVARGELAAAGRLYQVATGWLVLITWPTYLLFAVFAEPMLSIFGEGYTAGQAVTVTLALTMLLATACGMVDTVLNMAGKTSWTFYNTMAALAVNVVGNLVLIPPYGIMGAAVAWCASVIVGNISPLVQLYVSMRLHPFGRGTLTAAGLAVVCFGLPPLVARPLFGSGLSVLVVTAILGAACYAGAAWRLRGVLRLDALRRPGRVAKVTE